MPVPKSKVLKQMRGYHDMTTKEMKRFIKEQNVQDAVDLRSKFESNVAMQIDIARYIMREQEYLG